MFTGNAAKWHIFLNYKNLSVQRVISGNRNKINRHTWKFYQDVITSPICMKLLCGPISVRISHGVSWLMCSDWVEADSAWGITQSVI